MQKTKEIRSILMGRTIAEKGVIRFASGREGSFFASGNGVLNAMLLGVMQCRSVFQVPKGRKPLQDGAAVLSHMGRKVTLTDTPDVVACLRRSSMSNQKLFTADVTPDGMLELSVFMGRTFWGIISMRLALYRCKGFLPEEYQLVTDDRQDRREKSRVRREKRKEKRADRKIQRSEKRKEKLLRAIRKESGGTFDENTLTELLKKEQDETDEA